MPVSTFQYERPPFEIPEITAEALERGQRVADALRTLAEQFSIIGDMYDANLLDLNLKPNTSLVAIPQVPIGFITNGWKAHKGKGPLSGECSTYEPVRMHKVKVQPHSELGVYDWGDLRVFGESEHWTPQNRGVNAHQMYESYWFALGDVKLALIQAETESN